MFDIGFGEMLLLAAIALIALGPKQLPEVARTLGRFMNQMKRATGEFQRTLAEVSDTAQKHVDTVRETVAQAERKTIAVLEQQVVPAGLLDTSGTQKALAQPSAGVSPAQLPLAVNPSVEIAADDHLQMAFDIDKKES